MKLGKGHGQKQQSFSNRPWTPEDENRLLALRAAGRSGVSMAAALRRSVGSVEERLRVLRKARSAQKQTNHPGGCDHPS
jgi:hypothetical protein